MGLLGSVAAAQLNRSRTLHYYLARQATLERGPALLTAAGKKLEARGRAELAGGAAHAKVTLHDRSDALLYTLRIDFSVLDQKGFERVFSGVKRDLRRQSRPPVNEQRPSGELRVMR